LSARIKFLLIVIIAISPTSLNAQTDVHSQPVMDLSRSRLSETLESIGYKSKLRLAILGYIATSWINSYDEDARRKFSTEGWWSGFAVDLGDSYGYGWNIIGLSASAWGIGAVTGDSKLRTTSQKILQGLAINGAIVIPIKMAVGRRRPDGSDHRSFPSGHTSNAFTASTVLARRHGLYIGVPAYALASLTAVARLEDSRHFASDVVAGAFIGIIAGQLATPSKHGGLSRIQPYGSTNGAGIRLTF